MSSAVDAGPAVVTLLFTDIVGSTELLSRLGDDAYEIVRRKHFRMLHEAVVSAGGAEVKNLGDGLMAAFPSAVDALGCALAIQRAVARHNRRAVDDRFDVRVGLHVGEPIRDEEDYFGTPVVIAKRLCDLAEPGQTLTSRLVADLAGTRGGFRFVEMAPATLKGFSEPMAVCAVARGEGTDIRPLPPTLKGISAQSFVGRDAELAALRDAWALARRGERQVVLIAGEPGIGKTTLAVRLAEEAAAEGATVLFGRCDEESVVPFQPFVEAVTHYVNSAAPDELHDHVGPRAADLALLVPSLQRSLTGADAPLRPGADTDRYRLFESVADLFAGVSAETPVVLVLDDLHWADRPSLQLVQHLVRRSSTLPLLVLGTYRDTDLARKHPLAEVLVDLRRAELVGRVPLRGLGPEDVLAMVAPSGAPARAEASFAEALWQETEGSPLFLREILRHLAETGVVTVDVDGRWTPHRRIDQLGIPEGVKELIGRRLSRLSDAANSVLLMASVVGRDFDVDLVERLTDFDADTVLDALDEACAGGIVAEVGHRPGRYGFTHALVRQALYEQLSLTRRVRYHQRVGEALEGLGDRPSTERLSELAHHFSMAAAGGQADKAIEYCRRAGEANMANVAYEEAARQFATALEIAEETETSIAIRCDLLLLEGEAQWRAGDPAAARAAFRSAAALARDEGDAVRFARAALGFVGDNVRAVWVEIGVVNDEGLALLEEGIDMLGAAGLGDADAGDDRFVLEPRLLSTLARELYWLPDTRARRRDLSDSAVSLARRTGDDLTLACVLANRWLATDFPDALEQRRADAGEVLELGERLGDLTLLASGSAYAGAAALEAGDIPQLTVHMQRFTGLADELKDPTIVLAAEYAAATIAELEGDFAGAEKLRTAAFVRGQEAGDRNAVIQFLAATAVAMRRQGQVAEVLGMGVAAMSLYPLVAAPTRAMLACGWADLGDALRARQELDLLDPTDPELPVGDLAYLFFLATMSEAVVTIGDRIRGAQLYELLAPYAHQWVTIGHVAAWGSVQQSLGSLASLLGRHDEAVAHLRAALVSHEASGFPVPVVDAQARLAATLAARAAAGDREEAKALARTARDRGGELGMIHAARLAEHVLEGASLSTPVLPSLPSVRRRDRGRSKLTAGARSLVGRFSRDHDDADLIRRFGRTVAQRSLFAGMARSFQPRQAFGFEGELQFDIELPSDDAEPDTVSWTLEVEAGRATSRQGRATAPVVTVRTELPELVRLLSGERHPLGAVLDGKVRIDGDVVVAARITDMFGGLDLLDDPAV